MNCSITENQFENYLMLVFSSPFVLCNFSAIINLAKSANYPPYLFCRYLVEHIAILKNGRKSLTQAMRDPVGELGSREVISKEYLEAEENIQGDIYNGQTRLSFEVCEAVESDPMYGPMHDRSRHFVGVEYEVVLERTLSDMGKCSSHSFLQLYT